MGQYVNLRPPVIALLIARRLWPYTGGNKPLIRSCEAGKELQA